MEAKVVCLVGPDFLDAPGFVEVLDPVCCVYVKQNNFTRAFSTLMM